MSKNKYDTGEPGDTASNLKEPIYAERRQEARVSIDEEVEEWAERERRRRRAWLEGPTEQDKHEWARRERRRRLQDGTEAMKPAAVGPTDEEVEEWVERERRRRRAWLEGPTEQDKHEWARRERRQRVRDYHYIDDSADDPEYEYLNESASRMRRESELAARGAFSWLMDWPYHTWARLVETGRHQEESSYRPRRRRRIEYYDR